MSVKKVSSIFLGSKICSIFLQRILQNFENLNFVESAPFVKFQEVNF